MLLVPLLRDLVTHLLVEHGQRCVGRAQAIRRLQLSLRNHTAASGLTRLRLCLELRVEALFALMLMHDLPWIAGHRVKNRSLPQMRVLYGFLLLICHLCVIQIIS